MKYYLLLIWLLGCLGACDSPKNQSVKLNVIPLPEKISFEEGCFQLNKHTILMISSPVELKSEKKLLNALISKMTKYELQQEGEGENQIYLQIDTAFEMKSSEAYRLQITPEQICITANSSVGVFYGIQTLGQLLIDQQFFQVEQKSWCLPALTIIDSPAFPYRGLHLDVSRHFFPKEFVMKCLDWMAFYKLNHLHWHLTDAAGWRVEIKKYPKLTEKAAWRTKANYMEWWQGDRRYSSQKENGAYGGYYTQEEIREIVAYAAQKYITIIPEIEMPGHSEEVVSVYPHLGCYGEPYRSGEFCIGNEKTFEFLEDVLTEILELFPSKYIHIGGDEASTSSWKQCPLCQQRMKKENLKNERELQSYLIHRVEKFLNKKGRKLLGWDEILEGGLAPNAIVMSWRGEKGGIKAAKMGNDVIMTPGEYCYFDSYQADPETQPLAIGGYLPYLKVYSYHPIPNELSQEEAKHILGAQANVWSEYISTPSHAEYMIFPRLLALSEVVWSPKELREEEDFKRRIANHIIYLQKEGVNTYPLSNWLELHAEVDTIEKQLKITFTSEKYQPEIRYVFQGKEEQVYQGTFFVKDSARLKAYIVKDGKLADEILERRLDYHRAIGKKVTYQQLYNDSYPAAGKNALTDGYQGGLTYGDGRWQGFLSNVEVVIDLDTICDLSYVSARFMQLIGPGVYMPNYVLVNISEDGKDYREVARIDNVISSQEKSLVIRDFTARFQNRGRYVKFFAQRQRGFLFIDEITVY